MIKKKVLVVEDDSSARYYFKVFLTHFNEIDFYEAEDGRKGFEIAKMNKPDLILLDNKMPNLSGEQAAKLLRFDPITKDIPIIMVTAMKVQEQHKKLILLDVNEFVQKPINPWDFQKTMEKYLGPLTEKVSL